MQSIYFYNDKRCINTEMVSNSIKMLNSIKSGSHGALLVKARHGSASLYAPRRRRIAVLACFFTILRAEFVTSLGEPRAMEPDFGWM